MKLETINGIRVVTPKTNMWLCNEEQQVISDKVYLGVNADETMWKDITEEEKEGFEALWNTEMPNQEKIDKQTYEQIIDILSGEGE